MGQCATHAGASFTCAQSAMEMNAHDAMQDMDMKEESAGSVRGTATAMGQLNARVVLRIASSACMTEESA